MEGVFTEVIPYYSVPYLLTAISEPYQSICLQILNDNNELFHTIQGSSNNHQAWVGGYYDHVQEVLNIANLLFSTLNSMRPLPFTLSDALLVLFLHDIEKPWKYELCNGEVCYRNELETKQLQRQFRETKLIEYGLVLTPEQQNALKYVEGEHNDYTNKQRIMNELAAFCHLCDTTSARIWWNYPCQNDTWKKWEDEEDIENEIIEALFQK